jgi:hypothetical protein
MDSPLVVNWGGGVNSTAMLIGMNTRGIVPDLIVFADTGGEKPHTLEYGRLFQQWLRASGMPELVTVQNDGIYQTLENNCLQKKMLPSLVYGFKSCSDKYKRRPVEKFERSWGPALRCWELGGKVTKAIGYDAAEERRAKIPEDARYRYWYPLLEWGWERSDCLAVIAEAGLPSPGKSACFFCPASTKQEVLSLSRSYPALFDRAVAMEKNAAPNLDTVKGLGRKWSWESLVRADRAQLRLFPDPVEIPCFCFDGGDE